MNRAVISGAGAVSAFGVGLQPLFRGLTDGKSAVGPIHSFDSSSFPVKVAGEVPVAEIQSQWLIQQLQRVGEPAWLERLGPMILDWNQKGMLRDRKISFALLAAIEACKYAGLQIGENGDISNALISIAIGLEAGFLDDLAAIHRADIGFDWMAEQRAALPQVRLRSPVDLPAQCLKEALGTKNPLIIEVSACAAGALSLMRAASWIERGIVDLAIAGASDSMVNPMAMGAFWKLGAPSPRASPDACRPFDRRRDGLVIGEGAAIFVLESEARARARKAPIRARIAGFGSTQDAYRPTAPLPDGRQARLAIEKALARSGLPLSSIGYINAHGTGTPLNDPAEIKAIRGAFGAAAENIPLSSIKGAIGHLMAASGSIELAACLLALEHGILPGTAHHKERDPECDLDIIGEIPRKSNTIAVLSNSFGFGGQNAAIVLERCSIS